MSDTKALENNFWCGNCGHRLILHMSGKCVGIDEDNQTCNCQAAAELSQLRAENAALKSDNGQLVMYNERANEQNKSLIHDLAAAQERLKSARKIIDAAAHELGIPQPGYISPVANAANMLWEWLAQVSKRDKLAEETK